MGGAIALLPDEAGNITPNAEFNFWVDPEAARVTLRSGIPIELSPLNVSRKTALTKGWYEKTVAVDTPLTQLLKDTMGRRFATDPDRKWLIFVDANIDHGINYGVSVGGRAIWPGAEGAQKMEVQYDLDWSRFIDLFANRIRSPMRGDRVQATSGRQ